MTDDPVSHDRRDKFEADLAEVRGRTGTAATEGRLSTLGVVLAVSGVVIALVSLITSGTINDSRELLERLLLSLFGLSLTILGVALFLRYSMGRYLRFWMLRLLYEQQDDD